MKRTELLRQLNVVAGSHGRELVFLREGSRHTLFIVGRTRVIVPRHREINEYTAQAILRSLRKELRRGDL